MLLMFIFINLFSSFNPNILNIPLNWMSSFLSSMLLIPSFWLIPSKSTNFLNLMMKLLTKEFKNLMNSTYLLILISLFIYIMFNNMLGLFPYIFTSSTHMTFTLSLALPLWLGHMIISWKNQPLFMLAHLVPMGTPFILQPFMVLIEIISNIIRPLTLAIRLMANMMAGHLILTLLGAQQNFSVFNLISVIILVGVILIFILELNVALIQAYVFSILSTLYISEVNSLKMKKII